MDISIPREDGIVVGKSGIRLLAPSNLSPPKRVEKHGMYPLGDFSPWVNKHIPIFGVSCKNAFSFYVQLNIEETNSVLDCISAYIRGKSEDELNKLHRSFPKNPTTECENGVPCLALFPGDNDWYRARIVGKLGSEIYRVLFVDYGTIVKIPRKSLIQCPPELCEFVEGASLCAISGFTGDESVDEIEALKKLVTEKDLIGRIDSISIDIRTGQNKMFLSVYDLTGVPIKTVIESRLRKKLCAKDSTLNVANRIATPSVESSNVGTIPTKKLFTKPASPVSKDLEEKDVVLESESVDLEIPALVTRDATFASTVQVPQVVQTGDTDVPAATASVLIAPRNTTKQPELDLASLLSLDSLNRNESMETWTQEELREKLVSAQILLREKEDTWNLEKRIIEDHWCLRLSENDKYFHHIMHEKTRVMDILQKDIVQFKSESLRNDHNLRNHIEFLQNDAAKKEKLLAAEIQSLRLQHFNEKETAAKLKQDNGALTEQMDALKLKIEELTEINTQLGLKEEGLKAEFILKDREYRNAEQLLRSEIQSQGQKWLKKLEENEVKLGEEMMAAERKLEFAVKEKDEEIRELKKKFEEYQLRCPLITKTTQTPETKVILTVDAECQGDIPDGCHSSQNSAVPEIAAKVSVLDSDSQSQVEELESRIEEQDASILQLSKTLTALIKASQKEKKRLEDAIAAKNKEIADLTSSAVG